MLKARITTESFYQAKEFRLISYKTIHSPTSLVLSSFLTTKIVSRLFFFNYHNTTKLILFLK